MRIAVFTVLVGGLVACGDISNNTDGGITPDAGPSADGMANLPGDAMPPDGDAGPGDVTPPETTIDSAPPTPTNQTGAAFQFSSSESGTFRCRVGTDAFAACTSPHSITVGEGSHTFEVFAIDDASNPDLTPASHSWLVDTTAPVVTISSGPSDPTSSATANFEFASNESGTLECQLDGGGFAACTSPHNLTSIQDGSHTFQVRATDAAGNTGTDSYTWSRDGSAPTIVITTAPSNPTNSTSASFVFQAEAGATVQCRLDGAAFGNCATATTMSYSGLSAGTHVFDVQATDASSNSAIAKHTWSIDTTPPVISIIQKPTNPTASTGASFTFSANEAVTWQCRMDNGSYGACAAPGSMSYSGLGANVSHTFRARGTDAAGNVGTATYTWTIDTQPPTTTIQQSPSSPYPVNYATFTWTSNDANASYECRNDGSAWAACISPKGYSGLSYSSHTFEVRATDALGNQESSHPTHNWTATPGLLLYYKFDSDTRNGSVLGGDHDGAGQGFDTTTGKFVKALQFEGNPGSYLKLPDTIRPLTSHYNYTISMWVFEAGLSQDNEERILFDFMTSTGGFKVYRKSSEDLELFVDYRTKGGQSGSGQASLGIKIWHNIIFEHRPASANEGADIAVYIDGRLNTVIKNPSKDIIFAPGQLDSMLVGANSYFAIDELRVYNRIFDDKGKCTELMMGQWIAGNNYCELP